MSTVKKTPTMSDVRVVDVDVHVNDTPPAIAPYCEEPWRRSMEMINFSPKHYLNVPGFGQNLNLYPPFPGIHPKRHVLTAKQMREELDELGIDDCLLLPDNLLLFACLPTIEWANVLSRAYNRWLTAEWVDGEKGLHGAIMACPQDPEESAKEILRYAGKPGIVAVYLPTAGVNPLWGHRRYDPIMAAAQEADLPLVLHSVSTTFPAFPFNVEQFENNWARQVIAHSFAMQSNLISLMHTGVPARYPKLKFVFTEAGVAWVPHVVWRMDRYWTELRRQVPFLELRPSDYVRRQMWFATQPYEEPDVPEQLAETIRHYWGEDRTLFASDWPHHDFDHPSAFLALRLSPEAHRKLMGQNAVDLFKLPVRVKETA